MVRRQWVSQGCSHTRPQTEGKGLSFRIRRMASSYRSSPTREMYPGTSTWAGHSSTQGTLLKLAVQLPWVTWAR